MGASLRAPAVLAAAFVLLAGCGPKPDILRTWEPDIFRNGRVLGRWEAEGNYRLTPDFRDPSYFAISLLPDHVGFGVGLPLCSEVRAGVGLVGRHLSSKYNDYFDLYALELRANKQVALTEALGLSVGGGIDLVTGFSDLLFRYYGQPWVLYYGSRKVVQASFSSYSPIGLGLFLPVSVSWTDLLFYGMHGWSVTPGIGASYEGRRFYVRAAYAIPLGRYSVPDSSRNYIREMKPHGGIQFGARVRLFEQAR